MAKVKPDFNPDSPAVVPEEAEATAGKYRVHDYLDARIMTPDGRFYWPGEEFEAVFPPDQEARLIERGQIEKICD